MRDDLTTQQAIYMLSAIFTGFLVADPLLPANLRLPDAAVAELVGDAIERALGSGQTPTAEVLESASAVLGEYMDHALAAAKAEFQRELEAGPSP